MDTPKEFQILLRRKIPYISEGLWGIVVSCSLILFLLYFLMLPAKNTSGEVAIGYYILVIPEWLKRISSYALVGLLIFLPLYYAARLKKPALLTIGIDTIFIKGKQVELIIPFKNIKKIYFNDLTNYQGLPKEKMQIVIQQKTSKVTTFILVNYEEAESAVDNLGKITTAQFAFYESSFITTHDEDE